MTDDVKWANGMDGDYVYGHEAVKDYWDKTIYNGELKRISIRN
jgi:hypothetical protein